MFRDQASLRRGGGHRVLLSGFLFRVLSERSGGTHCGFLELASDVFGRKVSEAAPPPPTTKKRRTKLGSDQTRFRVSSLGFRVSGSLT